MRDIKWITKTPNFFDRIDNSTVYVVEQTESGAAYIHREATFNEFNTAQ
jgi:hypothetical protein